MMNVTTDYQHVHTDTSVTEQQVLKLATERAATVQMGGTVLVDLKQITNRCPCGLKPEGKGWVVIVYHILDT